MAQVLIDAGLVLSAVRKAIIDVAVPVGRSSTNQSDETRALSEIEETASWAMKYPLAGKYVA